MKNSVRNFFVELMSRFCFATVKKVVTKPEDISSIERDGITNWDDEPGFENLVKDPQPGDIPDYSHYFGFTITNVYFQRDAFLYHYSVLGINVNPTKHHSPLNPPVQGEILLGYEVDGNKLGQRKMQKWTPVHPKFQTFVEMCLSPEKWTGKESEALTSLRIKGSEHSEYFVLYAKILIFEQYDDLVAMHKETPSSQIDEKIHYIAEILKNPEIWMEFKRRCIAQNVPSDYIKVEDRKEHGLTSLANAFQR